MPISRTGSRNISRVKSRSTFHWVAVWHQGHRCSLDHSCIRRVNAGPGSLLLQSVWCSVERYRGASGKEGGLATEALHLCVFTLNAAKHHVRGNFPGHITTKIPYKTIFSLCLSCFCIPLCPLYLIAPIRTHPHPFSPVCIRLYPKLQSICII